MTNKIKTFALSTLFILSTALSVSAAELKPLQDWMQSLVDDGKVVGCMAQITQGGKTIFLEAVGDRNPESNEALTVDQVVRIYSMSKAITSAAVMQLVEQGRLGIDDPVSMYIPEFEKVKVFIDGKKKSPRRKITIRDLLTHTSGIAYGFSARDELKPYFENAFANIHSLEEAAKKIATLPLAAEPGSKFIYGLSIDVLGRVIEVVSGQEFGRYLQEHVFTPLSMTDTGFNPSAGVNQMLIVKQTDNGLAVDAEHYTKEADTLKPNFESGGGGLWSTLNDYSRFCMAMEQLGELDGKRILRPDTVKFMTQNQLSPGMAVSELAAWGKQQRFSLGFDLKAPVETSAGLRGGGRWSWGGAASTYFYIDPHKDVTAVFATQLFPFNSEMNGQFHHIVLESLAQEEPARE